MKAMFIFPLLAGCLSTLPPAVASEPGELEVAVLMLRLQTHADKLWWAGEAKNGPLAGFYLHELEEGAEELVEAHVKENGIDLSTMAGQLLVPKVEALEKAVEAGVWTRFEADYDALVTGCNSCHAASGHGFIRIQRPTVNRWSNQDFSVR